jgi:hypothetical protein
LRGPSGSGQITLWSARELDEAVVAHAAVTTTRSGFAEALAEVEERILERLPGAGLGAAGEPSLGAGVSDRPGIPHG